MLNERWLPNIPLPASETPGPGTITTQKEMLGNADRTKIFPASGREPVLGDTELTGPA